MRKKISFLPTNIFWCLSNGLYCYLVLTFFGLFTDQQAITISLLIYFQDLKHSTDRDYLIYQLNDKHEKFT